MMYGLGRGYSYGYGPMMGGDSGFAILMGLFWLLVLIGLIVLVVWMVRRPSHGMHDMHGMMPHGQMPPMPPAPPAGDEALALLRKRLAAGEISLEEFEKTKAALGG